MRVQPDEGVTLRFGSKVPGTAMEVRDVTMDFGYGEAFTESIPEAYERLMLDVLLGDPTLFPRHEEVELSWRILDPHRGVWAGQGAGAVPRRHLGPARRPTRCSPATAASGAGHERAAAIDRTCRLDTDRHAAVNRGARRPARDAGGAWPSGGCSR